MILRRSWPVGWDEDHDRRVAEVAGGFRKPHVIDNIPRMEISNFDYRAAFERVHEDLVLIEWDLAIEPADLELFVEAAKGTRGKPLVAPYWLHPRKTGHPQRVVAHQIIRNELDPVEAKVFPLGSSRFAEPGRDRMADIVGFGLIYLPRWCIRGYLEQSAPYEPLTDSNWSRWHHQTHGRGAPEPGGKGIEIYWPVVPIHLNCRYELPT